MTKVMVTEEYLVNTGNAIREKNGSSSTYTPAQFASAIRAIDTSGNTDSKTITANGTYDAGDDDLDGYDTVTVNVPNSYSASDEGKVVSSGALVAQTSATKTANGTYDTTTNNSVTVNVPNSYATSDEGKVVSSGALVAQTSRSVTANGTYDTTTNNSVVVDVPSGGITPSGTIAISSNGAYDVASYASANVNVPSSSPSLGTKTITQNGTYNASSDSLDGYSSVTVNVSGGGGVALLTQAEWNALTTAQKQAYGLVAIQNASSGFKRGLLVYGADYISWGLPASSAADVICLATPDNYDGASTAWGDGSNPVTLSAAGSAANADGSVAIKTKTSGTLAYVDLGAAHTSFTAYIVAKVSSANSSYTRLLSAMNARSSGNGIMLFGSTSVNVSSWASDTAVSPAVNPSSGYFVGMIQYYSNNSAKGAAITPGNTPTIVTKSPSNAGRYITIGRTDIDSSTYNAEPTDMDVLFLGVSSAVESDTVITENMEHLASVLSGIIV